ncbi:hypothetical protein [Flavobacterium sp. HNIBRBA15423]|uniref:hypothetical protein n=1 Tax=Flavobacterium sp. HNIBRBA15423 TaxID=3458683 RepID=UPI00404451B0
MEAIRQFVKVKNHQITITLPEDFNTEEVEVIILVKNDNDLMLSEREKKILDNRVKEPETEYISSNESLEKIRKKYGF